MGRKFPIDIQTEYISKAMSILGSKSALARALGIERTMLNWYAKGNLMKPHVALKLNQLYDWAKCERLHPLIWTKAMMDFQRAEWRKR